MKRSKAIAVVMFMLMASGSVFAQASAMAAKPAPQASIGTQKPAETPKAQTPRAIDQPRGVPAKSPCKVGEVVKNPKKPFDAKKNPCVKVVVKK